VSQAPLELAARLGHFTRAGVPKYVAMRDAVVDAVTSGAWRAGTRLPTESEWAATLPLSLGTIQRALRMLADDGVIVRRPKHGTFVAERGLGAMRAPLHCRFVDDSGKSYLPVYPRVTGRYAVNSEGPWSRHLGRRELACIDRTLRIASEFKVFSHFYFDPTRLPALASRPTRRLSGENFKHIIWRETGQPIGRISQLLSTSVELPADVCGAIGVKRGTRGLLLEVSAFAGRDNPIYYQELYIPPNGRRLHLPADGRDSGFETTS
jgi:DNA-binding GntR family transcriptional regulator